jgi:hypothetical protein
MYGAGWNVGVWMIYGGCKLDEADSGQRSVDGWMEGIVRCCRVICGCQLGRRGLKGYLHGPIPS